MIKNIAKSVGAVFGGFVLVGALSIITDGLMTKLGIFPSQANPGAYTAWMLLFALFYRSVFTVAGGYLTAKIAPRNPMHHVVGLMVLGGLGGVAGVIAGWGFGNHWYPLALAITGPLFVWFGGKIALKGSVPKVV